MGCGASIFGNCDSRRQHLIDARSGIVTPPNGQRGDNDNNMALKKSLRIDTKAPSRSDVGVAETPIGKQADEYSYYCPLCMYVPLSHLAQSCPPHPSHVRGLLSQDVLPLDP